MSKWINNDKFEEFKGERQSDNTKEDNITFARKWQNPKMGTISAPNEYIVRLLPDPNGNFYKKIHYHMFQSGESWNFIMCPKTHGMDEYCPWCAITQLLYQGSSADKKRAGDYKRKDKYVGNVYVIKDPRDANEQDESRHFIGKTFLYEFPAVVEGLIKKEVVDTENGWGPVIFDPEEGHNFILRIGAKKPDKNKKTWPDYTPSTFAKKPSSISDSDDEIEEIMETVQDIKEYIDNSMWSADKHEQVLKSEMIWDDVEDEFLRRMAIVEKETEKKEVVVEEDDTPDPDKKAHSEKKETTKTKKETKKETSNDDMSDEELLDELSDL